MTTGSNLAEDRSLFEDVKVIKSMNSTTTPPSGPLDELAFGKTIRQNVKEFSALMAVVLLAIGAYLTWKHGTVGNAFGFTIAAIALLIAGYKAPYLVAPIWRGWMAFAEKLGTVMTFLLLSAIWLGMFIPISIILRIFRIKVMNMGFHEDKESYWETRPNEKNNFTLLKNQF